VIHKNGWIPWSSEDRKPKTLSFAWKTNDVQTPAEHEVNEHTL
jgi:hypothetical protein